LRGPTQKAELVSEDEQELRSDRSKRTCPECGSPLRDRYGKLYCWFCEIEFDPITMRRPEEATATFSPGNDDDATIFDEGDFVFEEDATAAQEDKEEQWVDDGPADDDVVPEGIPLKEGNEAKRDADVPDQAEDAWDDEDEPFADENDRPGEGHDGADATEGDFWDDEEAEDVMDDEGDGTPEAWTEGEGDDDDAWSDDDPIVTEGRGTGAVEGDDAEYGLPDGEGEEGEDDFEMELEEVEERVAPDGTPIIRGKITFDEDDE